MAKRHTRAVGDAASPFVFLIHAYLDHGYEYEVYRRETPDDLEGYVKPVRGGWAYRPTWTGARWQYGPKSRSGAAVSVCAARKKVGGDAQEVQEPQTLTPLGASTSTKEETND